MRWKYLYYSLNLFLLCIGVLINLSSSDLYTHGPWIVSETWYVQENWIFPEDIPVHYEPGPVHKPSSLKTPLQKIGAPGIFAPPEKVAPEAQYGTILLIFIFGGAIAHYVLKPKTTRGVLAAHEKKRSKRFKKASRSIQRKARRKRSKDNKIRRKLK